MVYARMSALKDFGKEWRGKEKTLGDALRKVFGREKPLRFRLAMAHYKINTMVRRLEVYLERLKARDQELFERVVDAIMSKDKARATMYANEIAELRKVAKSLLMVQVALEHISLRIESIREIGEIVYYLAPVIGVVKDVRAAIKTVLPELGIELGEVQDILQETVMEAGSIVGYGDISIPTSAEARKILEEAKIVAEQRMKEEFPTLPATVPSAQAEEKSAEAHP